jgi:hypothetical protein
MVLLSVSFRISTIRLVSVTLRLIFTLHAIYALQSPCNCTLAVFALFNTFPHGNQGVSELCSLKFELELIDSGRTGTHIRHGSWLT